MIVCAAAGVNNKSDILLCSVRFSSLDNNLLKQLCCIVQNAAWYLVVKIKIKPLWSNS